MVNTMKKSKNNSKIQSIFTSKSNVLKFLNKQLKFSKIEPLLDFTINDWKHDQEKILTEIKKQFKKKKIIIRSSALGEDSIETSEAGKYESFLNIDSNSKSQLISTVNKIISSYTNNQNVNNQNQILVQHQTQNIVMSGVIFTRTPILNSPYYIINYEEGSSTTGVTHGSINKTIKLFKNIKSSKLNKQWKLLLKSIKELESIISSDSLDIEFGITKKNQIIIFQVRPITSISKKRSNTLDVKIKNQIDKNKQLFSKLQSSNLLSGNSLVFSDMADWNPAEIIGNNPKPLDYSLYDFLIMSEVWYRGRVKIGYQKFNSHSLMYKFGNKPYVNILASFNSLIPKNIPQKLRKKLMNFYLKKLSDNPHLHDKIEFEILFPSYDLRLKKRLNELKNHNFSNEEIHAIYEILLSFTQSTINDFPKTLQSCNESVIQLKTNRIKCLENLERTQNYSKKLKIAKTLLSDCKSFGTLPFSTMARISFVGNSFLKSLVHEEFFTQSTYDKFMNTIESPLSNFQNDLNRFYAKKMSKSNFLKKYGHLRPGTYDITIDRYDKENPFLNDIKFNSINYNFEKSFNISLQDVSILKDIGISPNELFSFIRNSLKMREEIKFEFTKNLSDFLEIIAEIGIELGFTRQELSFLDLKTIFSSTEKYNKSQLKSFWNKKINQNKRKAEINDYLILPPIIFSTNDFEYIEYYSAKPNFITEKTVKSKIINLDNSKKDQMLENKIVLLEHADPGFDWIFTRNPAGLITKYGGVASHMSIRCSEMNMPAAIGCGEVLYNAVSQSSKILLDCKNEQVISLEQKKNDEFFEEKKILKSLGYIK
ncbi:PEP/pyruvate-binding domain-containing protein [Nitrosopumilus sp.]|uniref:PEP/pyruvate-binding domain-containing protein n=1 Tax=Nitrosopumilus sp. TaxID=2024843 RepID=UPI003D0F57A2